MTELVMPKPGVNFNEVTIIEWKKKERERVEEGKKDD